MPDTKSNKPDKPDASAPALTPDEFMKSQPVATAPSTAPAADLTPDSFMQSQSGTSSKRTSSEEEKIQKNANKFFAKHSLIREGILGAFSGGGFTESKRPISDTAKAMKDTFTKPAETPDEIAVSNAGATLGPVIPLPVYRMVKGFLQQGYGFGQEAFNAVNWDEVKRRAMARDPELFQPGKSQSILKDPEKLVHSLSGLTTMIYTALKGGKKAGEGVSAGEGMTTTAQRMAGTGPKMVAETTAKTVADVEAGNVAERSREAKATENFQKETAAYQEKVASIDKDLSERAEQIRKQYADDVATRDKKISELQAKHAEDVAAARKEWVQKQHEFRQAERAAAEVEGKRAALQSAQKSYAGLIKDNVKRAHENVRSALDKRWSQLREEIGNDRAVNPEPIYDAVQKSREMLAGVPVDLKIFNDVVKEITEKDAQIDTGHGTTEPVVKDEVPFDRARTQFSAVGEKAYAADGNLRRALFNVYEAYDKALTKTAEEAGAGKAYSVLKKDWHQYMKDWNDMSAVSTGGSPLARLRRAVDNPVVAASVLGKFGDRLFATFARYSKDGANPGLMSKLRLLDKEARALPKTKPPKQPGPLETPAAPKLPEPVPSAEPAVAATEASMVKRIAKTPRPEIVNPAEIKARPTLEQMTEIIEEAKRQQAMDVKEHALTPTKYDLVLGGISAFGSFIGHNVGYAIPYVVARLGQAVLVSSDVGQRWLSRVTPGDIKVMQEILNHNPGEKFEVGEAIRKGLEARAKRGEKLPLPLRAFQGILNEAQIGSLLRLVAPPQPPPKPKPPAAAQVP